VRLKRIMPSLGQAIHNIFMVSSKEKMFWAYAQGVIASVQNLLSFGNWTEMKFPRNPMGGYSSLPPSTPLHVAIASSINSTNPKPAGFGFVYMFHEPFGRLLRLEWEFPIACPRAELISSIPGGYKIAPAF